MQIDKNVHIFVVNTIVFPTPAGEPPGLVVPFHGRTRGPDSALRSHRRHQGEETEKLVLVLCIIYHVFVSVRVDFQKFVSVNELPMLVNGKCNVYTSLVIYAMF